MLYGEGQDTICCRNHTLVVYLIFIHFIHSFFIVPIEYSLHIRDNLQMKDVEGNPKEAIGLLDLLQYEYRYFKTLANCLSLAYSKLSKLELR